MRDPRNWGRPVAAARSSRRPPAPGWSCCACGRVTASGRREAKHPRRLRRHGRCSDVADEAAGRLLKRADGRRPSHPTSVASGRRWPPATATGTRDRRLVLELRPSDLPGLHDADVGRHALPGVREAADEGAHAASVDVGDEPRRHLRADRDQRRGLRSASFGSAGRRPGGGVRRIALSPTGAVRAPRSPEASTGGSSPAGFLHAGFLHIGFNMYLLYMLGRMLEPAIGQLRFALALLRGAARGLVRRADRQPDALTVGASGAIFGLMGAAVIVQRDRGIDPMAERASAL